jgi:hypothetical protein
MLSSMEPEHGRYVGLGIESLPHNAQVLIIKALNSGNNLNNTINDIKAMSMTNKALQKIINAEYGDFSNLAGFTKLAHILAKKFHTSPFQVAEQFYTSAAEKYVELYSNLERAVVESDILYAKQLILKGADVTAYPTILYLAIAAIHNGKRVAPIVKLLLSKGANPYATGKNGETPLDRLNRLHQNAPEYEQIKLLLENAMQKGKT